MKRKVVFISFILIFFLPVFNSIAGTAPIYSSDFYGITNNAAESTGIGKTQLSMEVFIKGNNATFQISNTGPEDAVISEIYFDDADAAKKEVTEKFNSVVSVVGSGGVVSFSGTSIAPPELPGGNAYDFVSEPGFQFDAGSSAPTNGVNPGEMIKITIKLADDIVNDLANELESGGIRVGMHVIAFRNGKSESFINGDGVAPLGAAAVPEPGTMVLFGFGLIGLACIGRRRIRG